MNATIQIKNLSIGYRHKRKVHKVAENLTADVLAGQLTFLLGPNGAGKSTLLRTLSGFQPKLDGEVYVLDKEIGGYTRKELARVMGVVLTERLDVQNLTAAELVAMGRSPYTNFWGTLTDGDRQVVAESMRFVGIEALKDRNIQNLSDGERQKVVIAKALAQQTPIIILDEPTAFLDYPSKVEMMQLLLRFAREMEKTIFLSTHDVELALQLADRIWLMKRGNPLIIGSTEELTEQGALETFFDSPNLAYDSAAHTYRVKRP